MRSCGAGRRASWPICCADEALFHDRCWFAHLPQNGSLNAGDSPLFRRSRARLSSYLRRPARLPQLVVALINEGLPAMPGADPRSLHAAPINHPSPAPSTTRARRRLATQRRPLQQASISASRGSSRSPAVRDHDLIEAGPRDPEHDAFARAREEEHGATWRRAAGPTADRGALPALEQLAGFARVAE